jgi:hypothetical protein
MDICHTWSLALVAEVCITISACIKKEKMNLYHIMSESSKKIPGIFLQPNMLRCKISSQPSFHKRNTKTNVKSCFVDAHLLVHVNDLFDSITRGRN